MIRAVSIRQTLFISIVCPTETFTLDKNNPNSEDILVTTPTTARCDVVWADGNFLFSISTTKGVYYILCF